MPARIYSAALAAALAVLPRVTTAQQSNPVADAFRDYASQSAKNLMAAAEEFPADKFSYKPTAPQMSVGEIAVHLAKGNDYLCGTIGGMKAPTRAAVMTLTTGDWADHYSQYANYLRLNGMMPPTAKKPAM